MTNRTAAIITLGRQQAMGELRRVDSWCRIAEAAGLSPHVFGLRKEAPATLRSPPDLRPILTGHTTLESLSWSAARAATMLRSIRPDVTIFVTLRAFSPRLLPKKGNAVLDLVDDLPRSYRDRSAIADNHRMGLAFRLLARGIERAHEHVPQGLVLTAAGRTDSQTLGATWVPNVVDVPAPGPSTTSAYDLVFFGNLSYPPNIAAVEILARWWPTVVSERPGTTLLVTGRHPAPRVAKAVGTMPGAVLEGGYEDPIEAARRARVAVAPLEQTAGIQNKIIEAAAAGVAQIVSTPALAGLPEGFPALVADDGPTFSRHVALLLGRPEERGLLARAALRVTRTHFSAEAWSRWLSAVFTTPDSPPASWP